MNTVVVYPYILPDIEWLKLASFCWDKVYRLSSQDAPSDPDEIAQLNERLGGFLESVYPDSFASDETASEFRRWLMWGKGKHAPSAVDKHDDDYFAMFQRKLPGRNTRVMKFLINHDMAKRREDVSPLRSGPGQVGLGDVLIRKDIALHYLSLVASQVAERKKADLFAENGEFTDTVFYGVRVARADVATGLLQAHLPDLSALSLDQLSGIRAGLGAGRLKYQRDVQELVDKFAAVASEGELESMKRNLVAIATEQIEQTKKIYRANRASAVAKFIGVSLTPAGVISAVASAVGVGIFMPASIVASLALAGALTLADLEKARAERAKAAWSYVLDVERAVS